MPALTDMPSHWIFLPLILMCYTLGRCGTTPPGAVIGLVTGAL